MRMKITIKVRQTHNPYEEDFWDYKEDSDLTLEFEPGEDYVFIAANANDLRNGYSAVRREELIRAVKLLED